MNERKRSDKPGLYQTLKTFVSDAPDQYATTFWFYSDIEQNLIAASKSCNNLATPLNTADRLREVIFCSLPK